MIGRGSKALALLAAAALILLLGGVPAFAHGVSGGDAAFMGSATGWNLGPYLYLGAKHMVTGYDHILFLIGVVFFLDRFRDVAIYVSMFSIGHSITLLIGVLGRLQLDAFLIDAVIGLSVVYKGFDNLGGFRTVFGVQPNQKLAVLGFGLFHGFGLATKLQGLSLSDDGLLPNMLAFNIGVELGQITALALILGVMTWWRRTSGFGRQATLANVALMIAGFVLMQYQLTGYFLSKMT